MSYMYGWTCSIRKVLSVVFPLFFLGDMQLQLADHAHPPNKLHKFTENDIATDWMALSEWVHASCGLFEVEISCRTNKDGKYIEGNTTKVDIAIVFFEFFWN